MFFPNDLTALAPANVSELLGKYTQLYAYALQCQADYAIAELKLKQEEAFAESRILSKEPNALHLEKWRKEAKLSTYPELQQFHSRWVVVSSGKKAAETFATIYQSYVSALSRELSRRSSISERSYGV